jgi:hypothetical protein
MAAPKTSGEIVPDSLGLVKYVVALIWCADARFGVQPGFGVQSPLTGHFSTVNIRVDRS